MAGVLIIGSGFTTHNMNAFFGGSSGPWQKSFPAWLTQTITSAPGSPRSEALVQWTKAPGARQAHPREEHLVCMACVRAIAIDSVQVPLFVAAGAGEQGDGQVLFDKTVMGFQCANCYAFD